MPGGKYSFELLPGNYVIDLGDRRKAFSVATDQATADLADLIGAADVIVMPSTVAEAIAARDAALAALDDVNAAVDVAIAPAVANAAASAAAAEGSRLAAEAAAGVEVGYNAAPGFTFADRGGFVMATIRPDGFRGIGVSLTDGALDLGQVQMLYDATHNGLRMADAEGFYYDVGSSGSGATVTADTPIISDGSKMYGWRARLAQILDGQSVTAKLLLIGDSWFQRSLIPDKLAGPLYAAYGRGADGWLCIGATGNDGLSANSWTMTATGWTIYDATDGAALPLAIDGFRADATGTTATLTTAGWWGSTLNIYYRQTTGVFRYRIDGGAWNTVTGTGTNAIAKVSVTGLSATASHTLEIDLTGNAGTVTLYGFYATGLPGFEMIGAGNGSAIATDYSVHIGQPESQYILADMAPHATLICLGNNDRAGSIALATYSAALVTIMSQISVASPLAPFVMLTAPRNGRGGSFTAEDYAAEMIALADGRLVEWVDYTRAFGPYADMNTLGAWADAAHLSAQGARLYAQLVTPFLTI